jgi:hypothetical protein
MCQRVARFGSGAPALARNAACVPSVLKMVPSLRAQLQLPPSPKTGPPAPRWQSRTVSAPCPPGMGPRYRPRAVSDGFPCCLASTRPRAPLTGANRACAFAIRARNDEMPVPFPMRPCRFFRADGRRLSRLHDHGGLGRERYSPVFGIPLLDRARSKGSADFPRYLSSERPRLVAFA